MGQPNVLLEYADHVAVLARCAPELANELGGFHSLEQVLDWLRASNLPFAGLDLVTQDEYSHDLLVPLPGERYLVFGMS